MSLQDAVTFVQTLQKDPELQKTVQGKDDGIRAGAEMGLTFTAEELSEAYTAQQSELSDEDLKKVSGGLRPLW